MKSLVVDDDLTTRIVLQEILSRYSEVHSCVDGNEAVQVFTRPSIATTHTTSSAWTSSCRA